jgi:hypothetical protein
VGGIRRESLHLGKRSFQSLDHLIPFETQFTDFVVADPMFLNLNLDLEDFRLHSESPRTKGDSG